MVDGHPHPPIFHCQHRFLFITSIISVINDILLHLIIFIEQYGMMAAIGLSKFAKLARSVTRSRQFSAHIPTIKDPSKQSNLAQVIYIIFILLGFFFSVQCPLNLLIVEG